MLDVFDVPVLISQETPLLFPAVLSANQITLKISTLVSKRHSVCIHYLDPRNKRC